MSNSHLTHEAREAIRKYMLRIVAIPGLLISLLMFILGYLINDVATKGAYNDAFKSALGSVVELMQSASSSAAESKRLRMEIASTHKEARAIFDDIVTVSEWAESEKVDKAIEGLMRNPSFSKRVVEAAGTPLHVDCDRTSLKSVETGKWEIQCPDGKWLTRFSLTEDGESYQGMCCSLTFSRN